MSRVSANAPARPMPIPIDAWRSPSPSISQRSRRGSAPSASRIPSRAVAGSLYDSTPHTPTAAITSARAAKQASSTIEERAGRRLSDDLFDRAHAGDRQRWIQRPIRALRRA